MIEVLSPGSRYMDMVRKLKKYRDIGAAEYWMIFPEEKKIQVYLFEQQADGEAAEPMEYTFADKVPMGIWDGKCEVDFADL